MNIIFTARKRSLGQGHMFTGVCLSTGGLVPGGVWSGGVWSGGGAWSRGSGQGEIWSRGLPGVGDAWSKGGGSGTGGAWSRGLVQGGAWWWPPRRLLLPRIHSSSTASYWNAFLVQVLFASWAQIEFKPQFGVKSMDWIVIRYNHINSSTIVKKYAESCTCQLAQSMKTISSGLILTTISWVYLICS